jgi:hypothetical protein
MLQQSCLIGKHSFGRRDAFPHDLEPFHPLSANDRLFRHVLCQHIQQPPKSGHLITNAVSRDLRELPPRFLLASDKAIAVDEIRRSIREVLHHGDLLSGEETARR